MGLLDMLGCEILPSAVKPALPLTKENATTSTAVKALTEAQNGNLMRLVILADLDLEDCEDSLKASALFNEAVFSEKPHWLAEVVYRLADSSVQKDMLTLMEVIRVCPLFHYKILRRALQQGLDIAKGLIHSHERIDRIGTEACTKLATIEQSWKLGSAKTNRRYKKSKATCIQIAATLWQKDPSCLKKDMVIAVKNQLQAHNQCVPEDAATIRKWIDDAGKNGDLAIPPGASKRGRPTK